MLLALILLLDPPAEPGSPPPADAPEPAPAEEPAPPAGSLLLRGGLLVDGVSAPRAADLLIVDGRIAAIGEGLAAETEMDLEGAVVTPGLIDSHVHLSLQPGGSIRDDLDPDAITAFTLRAYVAAGVTTVLDAAGMPETLDALQALGERQPSPRILELGMPPALPDSYGPRVLPDMPTVQDAASLEAHLDRVAAREVVGLKVLQERGIVKDDWPVIEGELAEVLTAGAAARDLPLYVHAMSGEEALEALALAPHALMHTPMKPHAEATAALAAAGTWVVSTLNITASSLVQYRPAWLGLPWAQRLIPETVRAASQDPEWQARSAIAQSAVVSPGMPKWLAKRLGSEKLIARMHEAHLEATRALHAAGVPLVMGSDAPGWPVMLHNFHATSSVQEMQHLVDAGLSPAEALVAATSRPAEMLGQPELGRLEVGAAADLVVHAQDPLASAEAWTDLRYVVRAGELRTPEGWMRD